MKRLLLLICFFIGSLWVASSQEKDAYNFTTKDGDVIWVVGEVDNIKKISLQL